MWDTFINFLNNLPTDGTIIVTGVFVWEAFSRYFPSSKALGIIHAFGSGVHVIADGLHKLASGVDKLALLSDKIFGQNIKSAA